MAAAVATAVVRLAAMDVAVEVTTDSMPPMSLVMRDWTSPVRVRVKNATDCRCRWPKTLVRRPCMTCWPTLVLIQVWITPKGGGDRGDADHAGDQQDQQPHVPVREGGVDHRAEQERCGHAHDGGGDDDRGDDHHLPGVGGEQLPDAAQRHLAGLGLLGRGDRSRSAAPAGAGVLRAPGAGDLGARVLGACALGARALGVRVLGVRVWGCQVLARFCRGWLVPGEPGDRVRG